MGGITVRDFNKRLKAIDVKSLTATIIKEKQKEIIDLNREDQIFNKGVDAEGKTLGSYAKNTQKIYDKNPPLDSKGSRKKGIFNLFWTGKSYRGFYAYMEGLKLVITTNPRGRELLSKFSSSIFGFTKDNENKINWTIIANELRNKIRNQML